MYWDWVMEEAKANSMTPPFGVAPWVQLILFMLLFYVFGIKIFP